MRSRTCCGNHVDATAAAGHLDQVDCPVEHGCGLVDVALAGMGKGQITEDDRLGLVTTLKAACGALQDRACLRAVTEGEVAGALNSSEPVGREKTVGGIGSPHCLEVRFGGTKRSLTLSAVAEHGVAFAGMLRRLEAAACAAMALGLVNPWAALAGPFSPKLYPLDTVLGGGFGLLVAATLALVFHEITHGAGRPTRVVLAAVLVALAVAALVDPPVAGGARVVGVGLGLWLCLAGSLALLVAAFLALRRPAAASAPEG